MKIAYVNHNDVNNSIDGTTISIWVQGCPHRCPGCHNPETWDFNGTTDCELDSDQSIDLFLKENIGKKINKNGVKRGVSLLGGEPFAPENEHFSIKLIHYVRKNYPDHTLYVWTGYTLEELKEKYKKFPIIIKELHYIDILITDRFKIQERNVELKLRGSNNQRIWTTKNTIFGKRFVNITKKIDNRK